jgi:hypothetical protein
VLFVFDVPDVTDVLDVTVVLDVSEFEVTELLRLFDMLFDVLFAALLDALFELLLKGVEGKLEGFTVEYLI